MNDISGILSSLDLNGLKEQLVESTSLEAAEVDSAIMLLGSKLSTLFGGADMSEMMMKAQTAFAEGGEVFNAIAEQLSAEKAGSFLTAVQGLLAQQMMSGGLASMLEDSEGMEDIAALAKKLF